MTKRLLIVLVLCVLMNSLIIQSMQISYPLKQLTRMVTAVPLGAANIVATTESTPLTSKLVGAKDLVWRNQLISWKRIFKIPAISVFRWNTKHETFSGDGGSDKIGSENLYQPIRRLKAIRLRCLWMLLLWSSIGVQRASATITAATTAPVHFAMEPREAFAHPPKHVDTEGSNIPDAETFPSERQQRIRSRTGSVIIFSTALLAAARVNRNKRARFPGDDGAMIDDDDKQNLDPLSRRYDLKWLFPQSSPPAGNQEHSQILEVEATVVVESPTPQFLSTTNKIIASAKAIASQKLQSNLMKSRNGSVPTTTISSNSYHPMTIALPHNNKKAVYRQQQPKSPVEEARLQAKYAAIESLEERAFTVLVDLGMVELSAPDSLENAWQ